MFFPLSSIKESSNNDQNHVLISLRSNRKWPRTLFLYFAGFLLPTLTDLTNPIKASHLYLLVQILFLAFSLNNFDHSRTLFLDPQSLSRLIQLCQLQKLCRLQVKRTNKS